MGYCPFLAPGHDTASGVKTWAARCVQGGSACAPIGRACTNGQAADRTVACVTAPTCTHDTGARCMQPGLSRNGDATHFLVSRPSLVGLVSRHTFWCHNMVGLLGVVTHCWCRDTEAIRRAILVSRHTFWCRDMG